jgi:hypothetical protein
MAFATYTSLRRHYPDQVHRVEDFASSSQPGNVRLPVLQCTVILPHFRNYDKFVACHTRGLYNPAWLTPIMPASYESASMRFN